MMCNEQCFSLAIEKLLNIDVPLRAKYIRGEPNHLFIVLESLESKLLEEKKYRASHLFNDCFLMTCYDLATVFFKC